MINSPTDFLFSDPKSLSDKICSEKPIDVARLITEFSSLLIENDSSILHKVAESISVEKEYPFLAGKDILITILFRILILILDEIPYLIQENIFSEIGKIDSDLLYNLRSFYPLPDDYLVNYTPDRLTLLFKRLPPTISKEFIGYFSTEDIRESLKARLPENFAEIVFRNFKEIENSYGINEVMKIVRNTSREIEEEFGSSIINYIGNE